MNLLITDWFPLKEIEGYKIDLENYSVIEEKMIFNGFQQMVYFVVIIIANTKNYIKYDPT